MTSKTRFRVSALTTPGKTTNSMALSTIVRLDFEAGSRYNRVPKSKIHSKIRKNVEKTYGKKIVTTLISREKLRILQFYKDLRDPDRYPYADPKPEVDEISEAPSS